MRSWGTNPHKHHQNRPSAGFLHFRNTQLQTQIDPSQEMQALDDRLASIAESLLKKRNEAVEGRAASGIERQWRADQMAYEGLDGTAGRTDMMDFATGDAWLAPRDKKQKQSRVIVNIIRGKCETAEGRFSELQFPTDDRNWGLMNTPVSESAVTPKLEAPQIAMPSAQQSDLDGESPGAMLGQPPGQISDQAKQDDAKKRCKLMEKEIDDQLEECGFNGESRKAVRSAVRLGTGVLKGPNVVKSTKRAWIEQTVGADTAYIMKVIEQFSPASKSCDIWNIYPDTNCGSDPKRGAYIWERDHVLPREVRALIGVKGYNARQLLSVLEEEPLRTIVKVDKGGSQGVQATHTTKGAPYERWEYHGDVAREDLLAIGCDCPDGPGGSYAACVVFINDRPVKVTLNAIDTGELPYDFFQWVQIEDTPWGIGEPRKIIWQQRIITAAWRAMMDNAGASAGTILVLGKDVEPEDDDWSLNGNKIFVDYSEGADVSKAFAQYQVANNQIPLQNIIELALRFTDLESGTPALAQGEKGAAPETLGGMQLLMQGADTGRRRLVKQWDDQITRPHITRYYDWNMQYSKKQDIKGDFKVDARGTSVLLVKDQNAESLMQVLQMRGDPEVNILVDWEKAIKQLFQARHLDVLKDDEAIKAARAQQQQQPPPMAPAVQAAQIREQGATQRKQMDIKAEGDHAAADAHMVVSQQKFDSTEAEKDRQLQLVVEQINERIESMKEGSAAEISMDELKAMLAGTAMKLRTTSDLAVAAHAVDIHKYRNAPTQVITPAIEPQGRAKDGASFYE